jgi:hypothetical protein
MPKFDSHPLDPAPERSNLALNGPAAKLTAIQAISLMESGRCRHGTTFSRPQPWLV